VACPTKQWSLGPARPLGVNHIPTGHFWDVKGNPDSQLIELIHIYINQWPGNIALVARFRAWERRNLTGLQNQFVMSCYDRIVPCWGI
jgi:hypothetical protein